MEDLSESTSFVKNIVCICISVTMLLISDVLCAHMYFGCDLKNYHSVYKCTITVQTNFRALPIKKNQWGGLKSENTGKITQHEHMLMVKNFWIKKLWQSEQKELQMCLLNTLAIWINGIALTGIPLYYKAEIWWVEVPITFHFHNLKTHD